MKPLSSYLIYSSSLFHFFFLLFLFFVSYFFIVLYVQPPESPTLLFCVCTDFPRYSLAWKVPVSLNTDYKINNNYYVETLKKRASIPIPINSQINQKLPN